MARIKLATPVLLFLAVCAAMGFGRSVHESGAPLKVVTTTALIEEVAERVGGDKVDVVNIIPPAQCPGHFDVKPSDVQKLADADIFFLHGWQGEQFSDHLIASADNPNLTVVTLEIEGNWMTPPVHRQAVEYIADTFVRLDAKNSSHYQESSANYLQSIAAKEAEIMAKLEKLDISGIHVLCADMQAGFVAWVGFQVAAAYGRPDSLTPKVIKELIDKGREEGVSLIIDNLQSGKDAGAGIAEELGCARIILSNFPGGFENTETWEKAIDYNIEVIGDAIAP